MSRRVEKGTLAAMWLRYIKSQCRYDGDAGPIFIRCPTPGTPPTPKRTRDHFIAWLARCYPEYLG